MDTNLYVVLGQVSDIVKKPSTTPYEDIKKRLIGTYTESENKRIQRLLEGKQMGDETPSQFLRQMRQLAGDSISIDVVKTLWMRSLPPNTQSILLATGHSDVEKLAEVADKIHEVDTSRELCAVSPSNRSSLEEKVDKLAQQVAALAAGRSFRGRSRSRDSKHWHKRSSSKPRSKEVDENWLCFYHYKFREKARKCIKPCAWEKKSNTNQQARQGN